MPKLNEKFIQNIPDLDLLKLYGEELLDCLHSTYDKEILIQSTTKFVEQIRTSFKKE